MNKEIVRLMSVLLLGVVGALGLTAYFVMNYGPSGRYSVEAALLKPELLNGLNYNDFNPKTGSKDRFVFDKLEFVYLGEKDLRRVQLPLGAYAEFYQLVQGEKSLLNPSEEVKALFANRVPGRLNIVVKTESDAPWQKMSKDFQEVEFVPEGDYYRVQLHEATQGEHWAYFYHPGIYKQVFQYWVGL